MILKADLVLLVKLFYGTEAQKKPYFTSEVELYQTSPVIRLASAVLFCRNGKENSTLLWTLERPHATYVSCIVEARA